METRGGIIADHITDAVVEYINENTGNKVKCIMDVEYQAQRHPMMLLGFTNSRKVLEDCKRVSSRILREKKNNFSVTVAKRELTAAEKKQIKSDLKTYEYSRDELCDMYNCTASQIGAIIAHHGGGYVTA